MLFGDIASMSRAALSEATARVSGELLSEEFASVSRDVLSAGILK